MKKIDNEIADPLLELNLAVAARAGWENIEEWSPNPKTRKPKRTFTGTNKKHPELGVHIPDYTSDLNAITKVFEFLDIEFELTRLPIMPNGKKQYIAYSGNTNRQKHLTNPAIALCKLLLKLAPDLDDELCQKGYEQAVAETQPERGDFVTIAGLEIEA